MLLDTAPTWLSYTSPGIALFSLIVAIAAFIKSSRGSAEQSAIEGRLATREALMLLQTDSFRDAVQSLASAPDWLRAYRALEKETGQGNPAPVDVQGSITSREEFERAYGTFSQTLLTVGNLAPDPRDPIVKGWRRAAEPLYQRLSFILSSLDEMRWEASKSDLDLYFDFISPEVVTDLQLHAALKRLNAVAPESAPKLALRRRYSQSFGPE